MFQRTEKTLTRFFASIKPIRYCIKIILVDLITPFARRNFIDNPDLNKKVLGVITDGFGPDKQYPKPVFPGGAINTINLVISRNFGGQDRRARASSERHGHSSNFD